MKTDYEFGLVLTEYLRDLGCTAKTLAAVSGVSAIQLSRWRNGTRRPSQEALCRLADGLVERSGGVLRREEVLSDLMDALPAPQRRPTGVGERMDQLLTALRIHTSDVARALNFDASYLSRIRAGKRNPANIETITEGVSRYVARRCASESDRAVVAALMDTDVPVFADNDTLTALLVGWLRGGAARPMLHGADVRAVLSAVDSFDLNEYIKAIRIDAPSPDDGAQDLPEARTVSGLKNMMRCQLDFFRATERAERGESVFIYTDMPLTELARDPEYPKQWMQHMAALIRKGLEIRMIHNVDRPFEELLLGLEVHIPMYMTGRITPYYLKESNSGPFRHLLELSGAAALAGEAVFGHHAEGRYTLTYDEGDLEYYRRRADALLGKAAPLMDIYPEERDEDFRSFLRAEAEAGRVPVTLDMPAFRNVTVQVCHDRWAVVTKDRAPRVSFVIRHPNLVDALERFAAPLVD